MRKIHKTAMATGLALAAGIGFSGQASAGIYAGSSLLISDLNLFFVPTVVGSSPNIGQFDFTTLSSASVTPGGGTATLGSCFGNVANSSTSCGPGGVGTPVLAAGPAAIGPVALAAVPLSGQLPGTVTHLGPAGGVDYAYSDSIIDTAALVEAANGSILPGPTATRQISEAEISSADQAFSATDISSTTSFTYLFEIAGDGSLVILFEADPYLLAQFDDATATDATALADMELSFTLTSNDVAGGDVDINWEPSILTGGGCTANVDNDGSVGFCVSEVVSEDLNGSVTAPGPLPFDEDAYSVAPGFGFYVLEIDGLTAGNYSLGLNSKTQSSVTRIEVPEPATLLLLGSGLAMFGFGARRRKARTA